MRLLNYIIIIFLLFNLNLINSKEENLKTEITKNLRCLICQGQSVFDSDSEFANSVKILVENKINQGQTEDQIYNYLKDKYGDWILYQPEFNKNTYFLWLLPILMFVFGGAIILKKVILNKKKL